MRACCKQKGCRTVHRWHLGLGLPRGPTGPEGAKQRVMRTAHDHICLRVRVDTSWVKRRLRVRRVDVFGGIANCCATISFVLFDCWFTKAHPILRKRPSFPERTNDATKNVTRVRTGRSILVLSCRIAQHPLLGVPHMYPTANAVQRQTTQWPSVVDPQTQERGSRIEVARIAAGLVQGIGRRNPTKVSRVGNVDHSLYLRRLAHQHHLFVVCCRR